MNAITEIGWGQALKYAFYSIACGLFSLLFVSPFRVFFLSIFGARIGKNVVIENVKFINAHKKGFSALSIGDNCYLGQECLLDLSDKITLEENVTLASRSALITHTNVGYVDHALQKFLPKKTNPITIRKNSFIGFGGIIVGVTVLAEKTAVAAGAVVVENNSGNEILAGVPAKTLKHFS
ncbi:MAG: hypothetical protein V1494_00885 [Candidatus Diapherotrites archaeon]